MDDRDEVEAASLLPDKFTASDVQRVISAHHFRVTQLEELLAELKQNITDLAVNVYSQMTDAADAMDQIIEQTNHSIDQISEFLGANDEEVLIDHIELEEPERDRTEELEGADIDTFNPLGAESIVDETDEADFFLTEGEELDDEGQE